ncbi:MAG: hypothetical protein HUJ61_01900 [Bacilli bacterium]|nr:hypothetical protein [Bacilli bacterium]
MKFKFKADLFLASICLGVSALALCAATFSWFTFNRVANTNSGDIIALEKTPVVEKFTYYNFSFSSVNGSTVTLTVDQYSNSSLSMKRYDTLSGIPTQLIVKMSLNSVDGTYPTVTGITVSTSALQYIDQLALTNNSLSSIVSIAYLPDCVFNGTISCTYTNPTTWYDFVDVEENDLDTRILNILPASVSNKKDFYILIDYYEDSINNIYTNNIGNAILDDGDDTYDIAYKCDFGIEPVVLGA